MSSNLDINKFIAERDALNRKILIAARINLADKLATFLASQPQPVGTLTVTFDDEWDGTGHPLAWAENNNSISNPAMDADFSDWPEVHALADAAVHVHGEDSLLGLTITLPNVA